jgi:hypothetical protein
MSDYGYEILFYSSTAAIAVRVATGRFQAIVDINLYRSRLEAGNDWVVHAAHFHSPVHAIQESGTRFRLRVQGSCQRSVV